MKVIAPIIEELTSRGKEVVFTARGHSMRPLLKDGRDQIIFSKAEQVGLYDVVLYRRRDGSYVAHRIVGEDADGFILMGDGQTRREYGITREMLIARATGFIRRGKEISVKDSKYLCYVKGWTRSRLIRKLYVYGYSKCLKFKTKAD